MRQILTNNFRIFFLILLAATFALAQEPKTITDYYLELPSDLRTNAEGESYFFREPKEIKGKAAINEYRKSLISVADINNGYLKLDGNQSNAWDGWVEIALFKKTDGSYIVALSQVTDADALRGEIEFLTYSHGKWRDVTEQFSPKLPAETALGDYETYWKLPCVGRTLIFVETNEDVIDNPKERVYKEFKFEWDGTNFVSK